MHLAPLQPGDIDALYAIFEETCRQGSTLAQESLTRDEFLTYWTDRGGEQWTAHDGDRVLGGFTLRPNHPGRGAHIGTATYIVASEARGQGVGLALGKHSIERAKVLGFKAMQFNLVVSTNEVAVRLWQRIGFTIVGTLPGVFRHPDGRFVDAYVMYLRLEEGTNHEQ